MKPWKVPRPEHIKKKTKKKVGKKNPTTLTRRETAATFTARRGPVVYAPAGDPVSSMVVLFARK